MPDGSNYRAPRGSRRLPPELVDDDVARKVRRMLRFLRLVGLVALVGLVYALVASQKNKQKLDLVDAEERNDVNTVKALLRRHVSPDSANDQEVTVLMLAAFHGNQQIVDILLDAGAKVNMQDPQHLTALRWCRVNKPEIARILLEHHADPNAHDAYGKTLLMSACENRGPTAMIKLLLEHGADPNVTGDTGPPLIDEIEEGEHGDANLVKLLLEHGADPNAKDQHRMPAIACAVEKRSPEIVKALLDKGVLVNAPDALDRTALRLAAEEEQPEIADMLRKAGGHG